jgi:hypothetical protein
MQDDHDEDEGLEDNGCGQEEEEVEEEEEEEKFSSPSVFLGGGLVDGLETVVK